MDGIFGLAFPSLSAEPNSVPLFDNLMQQGKLDLPVFSVHISEAQGKVCLCNLRAFMSSFAHLLCTVPC
jgi:hypothetical protein